jgi:hypothetical protein
MPNKAFQLTVLPALRYSKPAAELERRASKTNKNDHD